MPSHSNEHLESWIHKSYDVVRVLGRGAYGVVWKVKDKQTGRVMALKKCFDAFQNSSDAQRIFREIIFLQALNGHENIVRLMGVMKAASDKDMYMLFDHMETDLFNVIEKKMLTSIHQEYVMYQLLKALKYIHSAGILHRDLKPSNILLNTNCHVRLCDFGLARTITTDGELGNEEADLYMTDYVATRWYRAPELLFGSHSYHEGVDMWSVGCILGEMLTGKPLLKGRSTMNQLERIFEFIGKPCDAEVRKLEQSAKHARAMLQSMGTISRMPMASALLLARAPEAGRKMAMACLQFSPLCRPTAEECLNQPYVEKFSGQEAEPLCEKVIRMPVPDSTKLRAGDYRHQIYKLIQARKNGGMSSMSPQASPRRSERKSASRESSPKEPSTGARQKLMECGPLAQEGLLMWRSEGGAAAPPVTPTAQSWRTWQWLSRAGG